MQNKERGLLQSRFRMRKDAAENVALGEAVCASRKVCLGFHFQWLLISGCNLTMKLTMKLKRMRCRT